MLWSFLAIWDHPHACGDKRYAGSELPKLSGSSPRVWGQVFFFFCPVSCAGIIPTRMGTRTSSQSPETQEKDHPHAYGDKEKLFILLLIELGSSPRVWGQDNYFQRQCVLCRIIPTRMGTRFLTQHTLSYYQDHPHAYGDKRVK